MPKEKSRRNTNARRPAKKRAAHRKPKAQRALLSQHADPALPPDNASTINPEVVGSNKLIAEYRNLLTRYEELKKLTNEQRAAMMRRMLKKNPLEAIELI